METKLRSPLSTPGKVEPGGLTKEKTNRFNHLVEKQKGALKVSGIMKRPFIALMFLAGFCMVAAKSAAQTVNVQVLENIKPNKLYIDVHQLEPGNVNEKDVANAHVKDIAVQGKYGVQFLKYWVNKEKGLVYCLSSAVDSDAIRKTHAEAHGLLPSYIYPVTEGVAVPEENGADYFLDIHELGAGNVSAQAVAEAHQKDLKVEDKHNVHFINYWVDEKDGVVMCLSKAKNADSIIATHREAHGLLPSCVFKVTQGK